MKQHGLKKIVSYPLSVVFCVGFFIVLLLFHVLQWLALQFSTRKTHENIIALLNRTLLGLTPILASTFTERNTLNINTEKQYIVVSNHQSLLDIPLLAWYLRKLSVKFIAKKELGKGIPSVSYNLRNGHNLLIDRKEPRQAVSEIVQYAKTTLKTHKYSVVIFPEGTRSRDGNPKPFATTGVKLLCKSLPDAYILPVTIHNSWKLTPYKKFPLGLFFSLELEYHPPMAINSQPIDTLLTQVEKQITSTLKHS